MNQISRPILPATGAIRRSRSAHDAALHGIGRAIVEGRFSVGTILPSKEDLMAQLDVSHTTLREAIQTLTAKGMLVAKAKVGTRVLPESSWNMFDADILGWRVDIGIPTAFLVSLFEIRQTLEPVAAALAAARRGEDDVTLLRELVTVLDTDASDRETFVEADVAFHQLILRASGNPFMHSIAALISTALSSSFALSAPAPHSSAGSLVNREHMAIVEAIAARDPQAASDAMMAVIRRGWTTYSGCPSTEMARQTVVSFERTQVAGRGHDGRSGSDEA